MKTISHYGSQNSGTPADWNNRPSYDPYRRRGRSKPKPTGVSLLVPDAFQVREFPELIGLENEAHWLLNKIIRGQVQFPNEDGRYLTRISQETMREYMHQDRAKSVVETMRSAGVIVRDPSYRVSEPGRKGYSMKYGLAPGYGEYLQSVECTRPSLARKLVKGRVTLGRSAIAPRAACMISARVGCSRRSGGS